MLISLNGDKLTLDVSRRDAHRLRENVPAGRCVNGLWTFPRAYEIAAMVDHLYSGRYTVTDAAQDWLKDEVTERGFRERYKTPNTVPPIRDLAEHQARALRWMEFDNHGILTMGTGTGKTRTMLEYLAVSNSDQPSLIVCPNSVRHEWVAEARKWKIPLNVQIVEGSAAARRKILADSTVDVFVIGYAMVSKHSSLSGYGSIKLKKAEKEPKELNEMEFFSVILDEAHTIRNPKNISTRACWSVANQAQNRFALTATPIGNDLAEVWALLRFVRPDIWTSRTKFIELFCDADEDWYGNLTIRGIKRGSEELFDQVIRPSTFGAKSDEVNELPGIIRHIRRVSLTPAQRKQYDALDKGNMLEHKDKVLPVVDPIVKQTRLRQIAQGGIVITDGDEVLIADKGNVKVQEALAILDVIPPDEQVVVFSDSKQLLIHVESAVSKTDGLQPLLLTGDQSAEEQRENIAAFDQGLARVLLCTLATASTGLNLQVARHAVFLMRDYSAINSIQAEGRIRRPGSKHETVHYWDVVTQGTIDEEPQKAIQRKTTYIEEVVS